MQSSSKVLSTSLFRTRMASYGVFVFVAAMFVISQAAAASELSIYSGPNCQKDPKIATIDCTNGHGSGADHACINFGKSDVSYTFKYKGTPLTLYYYADCGGQPAPFFNDIGCTQVANAKSYKVLCNH